MYIPSLYSVNGKQVITNDIEKAGQPFNIFFR